jgi:hypothetical protein
LAARDGSVAAALVTFVDSNLFVIALRYRRDRAAKDNAAALDQLRSRGDGVTSVVNLLEICGILSFNLNERQLRALYAHFERRFGVKVLPAARDASGLVPARPEDVLAWLGTRMSFGDALVADALERWAPGAAQFVSWNAKHFRGKVGVPALTPTQYLRE